VSPGHRPSRRTQGLLTSALSIAAVLLLHTTDTPRAETGTARKPEPPALTLPADIVYERVVGADSAVVFSHQTHVPLEGNKCLRCHPTPFKLLAPTRSVKHAEMDAGASCGLCHDGRQAFGVRDRDACQACHAGRPEVTNSGAPGSSADARLAAARKLPKPLTFTTGDASPGKVVFRHETHMKSGETCATCHPKPWLMKARSGKPGGSAHDPAACGRCHDGKKAFDVEDAAVCSRCHAEE
jgi:c(7)-type cytochrome triheme protein